MYSGVSHGEERERMPASCHHLPSIRCRDPLATGGTLMSAGKSGTGDGMRLCRSLKKKEKLVRRKE